MFFATSCAAVGLIALAIVGAVAAQITRQPIVVGELTVGVIAGAMVAHWKPDLLESQTVVTINQVATLGLCLFLFTIGQEIAGGVKGWRVSTRLAGFSAAIPFIFGIAAALWLLPTPNSAGIASTVFMGVVMAATALPVLYRILDDQDRVSIRVRSVTLGAAGLLDLAMWGVLAVVVASSQGHRWLLAPVAIICIVICGRIVVTILRSSKLPAGAAVFLITGFVWGAAALTEAAGLHYACGAVLAGVLIPRDGSAIRTATNALRQGIFVWPGLYFVLAGARVDLSAVSQQGTMFFAASVGAILTKIGGSFLGARIAGFNRHEASQAAVLMNTRGLTEIVILEVGREAGLITLPTFSALILMTLFATAITNPILRVLPRTTAMNKIEPVVSDKQKSWRSVVG